MGRSTCVDGVWGPCDAPPEVCDGVDNDCDGVADNGFDDLGRGCSVGEGVCQAAGTFVCDPAGDAVVCDAEAGVPGAETCDATDEDCDGVVDEDTAGVACAAGEGLCAAMGQTVCRDGVEACDAVAGVPMVEVCNGVDDDCDGQVDNDVEAPACTAGQGACEAVGVMRCVDGASVCDAQAGVPRDEQCNAVDDDCDAAIDEDIPAEPCNDGLGECFAEGATRCVDGAIACDAAVGDPQPEQCNGLDDDCNGVADNDVPALPCEAGIGACRQVGEAACVAGERICDAVAGEPGVEVCGGGDADCDGVDDNIVSEVCYTGAEGTLGVGTCAAGAGACVDGGFACADEVTPGVEACDALDNDCDGVTDEGECAACGDGFLNDPAEGCDDGNLVDGDDCDSACQIEHGALRLVDGDSVGHGRVEIFIDGQWGALCDTGFGIQGASVVCRQLGYLGAFEAIEEFPGGVGPINHTGVNCRGDEARLLECEPEASACGHELDVGVRCVVGGEGARCGGWAQCGADLSCVDGECAAGRCGDAVLDPRVEACDDGNDAAGDGCADCAREDGAIAIAPRGQTVEVSGALDADDPVWTRPNQRCEIFRNQQHYEIFEIVNRTDQVQEIDVRANWNADGFLALYQSPFDPDDFAGCVSANNNADGDNTRSALLAQVMQPGAVLTVVATSSANLAVFEPYVISVHTLAQVCGDGRIGVEERCDDGNLEAGDGCGPDCTPDLPDGALRVQDRVASGSGRLEMLIDGTWGTICETGFGVEDGDVACRQMGQLAVARIGDASLPGVGPIWRSDLECVGDEERLIDCPARSENVEDVCGHGRDVVLSCVPAVGAAGDVCRLNAHCAEGRCSGGVCATCGDGILHGVEACDDGNTANGDGCSSLCETTCGDGFVMGDEACDDGNLDNGDGCTARCDLPGQDGDVRLQDGDPTSGRLEVFLLDEWGSVCDTQFDVRDAEVACVQLGQRGARRILADRPAAGPVPIWMKDLQCAGDEARLVDCRHVHNANVDCGHAHDVAIECLDGEGVPGAPCRLDAHCDSDACQAGACAAP